MALIRRGKRGTYYLRVQIQGKPIWKSLRTSNRAAARAAHNRELLKLQAIHHGLIDAPAADLRSARIPTIGEVVEAYLETDPHDRPRPATRRKNVNMLRNVCRRAGIAKPDATLVSVLDATVVLQFQRAFMRDARASDEAAAAKAKFSANSTLTQARSVFANPRLLDGLELPDLESFRKAPLIAGAREHSVEFVPMTQAQVDALEDAAPALKANQPFVYVAFRLMSRCALRDEEVLALRPATWIRELPTGPSISIRVYPDFRPKGKGSIRSIGIDPGLLAELSEIWKDGEFAIQGKDPTERYDVVYRALNRWIQSIVPGRTAYDLRKQAGSNVLMQTRALSRTSRFLGHMSIATTQRWYVGLLEQAPVITTLRGVA